MILIPKIDKALAVDFGVARTVDEEHPQKLGRVELAVYDEVEAARLRVVLHHRAEAKSGVSEMLIWSRSAGGIRIVWPFRH